MVVTCPEWNRAGKSGVQYTSAPSTITGSSPGVFALQRPSQECRHRVPGLDLPPKDSVHLLDDGKFHSVAPSQEHGGRRGGNTLGHHLHPGENLLQLLPLSELDTDPPIPAEAAGAGQDQVTEPREAGEGRGRSAARHAEARDLRESPRDESGGRMGSEPDPLPHSRP